MVSWTKATIRKKMVHREIADDSAVCLLFEESGRAGATLTKDLSCRETRTRVRSTWIHRATLGEMASSSILSARHCRHQASSIHHSKI